MALESILLGVGGQLTSKIIARKLGPQFGDLADDVIGSLGEVFGVEPEPAKIEQAISATGPTEARKKVAEVEGRSAELVLAQAELQKAENSQLQLINAQIAQDKDGGWFGWAWRPAGMWGLGVLWFWNIIVLHVINAIFKIALPQADLALLLQLSALYLTLYMGGHTVKDFAAKKWGRK